MLECDFLIETILKLYSPRLVAGKEKCSTFLNYDNSLLNALYRLHSIL